MFLNKWTPVFGWSTHVRCWLPNQSFITGIFMRFWGPYLNYKFFCYTIQLSLDGVTKEFEIYKWSPNLVNGGWLGRLIIEVGLNFALFRSLTRLHRYFNIFKLHYWYVWVGRKYYKVIVGNGVKMMDLQL